MEEWLDEYVKGIALVSARAVEAMDMVTEDNRKERGDYDDFFKFKKKEHHGTLEERMANLEQDLRDYQELLEVFVQALIKRGWSTREELEQRWKQLHEEREWAGGIIVAKAWTDPEFKEALLTTGREALREMGVHQGKVGKLVVVENTDKVHNLVVCTLCSCYPYDILGDTPWWYKHESYRTNIVQDPRANRVLTSGVKRVDNGVYAVAKQEQQGKFKGGTDLVFNLKNGGMGIGKINPSVPASYIKLMTSYRTKIVENPRACAQEMFQLEIPAGKEVRVYDSTSDVRYFILPQRPAGTEGMSEEELAKLVTVDSLIGAGYALEPDQLNEVERTGAAPEMPRVRPD